MNAEHSALKQIPLQFGKFQQIEFETFLTETKTELLELIRKIASGEETQHLYLWGATATGKSHLLQAACKLAGQAQRQVAYIPLEQILEFKPEMLHDLGMLNLVCVDSLECVSESIEWQQTLVWLYNELRDNGHSMIIAGNASPANIDLSIEDLRSRLNWGLVFQLDIPSDEQKIVILKQLAKKSGFEFPDEVAQYLIQRVERDLHSLVKILNRIDEYSLAEKRKITVPLVRKMLESSL